MTLRCETMLHPQRSALRLLFSFYKEGHVLQDGGLHPELCIPGAQDGDSGLYWCKAAPEGGRVQKQSPQLEIRVRGKWRRDGRHSPGIWASGNGVPWECGEGCLGEEELGAWVVQLTLPTCVLPQLLCPILCSR